MLRSPIQLDFYYVESLSWDACADEKVDGSPAWALDDLAWQLKRVDIDDDGRKAAYRLMLETKPGVIREYSFKVVVVGHFSLDAIVPTADVAKVLDVNAPAVLYSISREVLAASLGRGPLPVPMLPAVHFMDVNREVPTPPKRKPATRQASKSKVARRKAAP